MKHELHIVSLQSGTVILSLEPVKALKIRLKSLGLILEGTGEPLMFHIESSNIEGRLNGRYPSHLQQ